ncbi:putative efflux outer membrane protein [Pusillimonas sp. T7-7]|uniref:TolC family protein n=1 Tax=Pusillimonas sp. (strain T7-7) TaxID=1007105 RepID=UPI0002084772|nr:TolC family protein [Pusillimonas sp. T7-7]AEC20413.1 putative efflux outer membrane protein [Pusillimonas sp. T7-7]
MKVQRVVRLNLLALAILGLTACSTTQLASPYTKEEINQRIFHDREMMYADQEPVTHPITFYEAAARALKYNLDYRLKLMESALARNLVDVTRHEMLPRLTASAGYTDRSNDSGGTSIGIEDRQVSLRPSTSEQRYHRLADLELTWSTLDFMVAYERSQQKMDQVLMAEERRRKVVQNVLQDVRNAYWRAVGAQRLIAQVDELLVRVREGLESAREAERRGLLPRQQALAYQRALLDAVGLLSSRRQDLELARSELAALMSLPGGVEFQVADEVEPDIPMPDFNLQKLEHLALENRPEIMEEWYRKRVTENDIKIAKAELWPHISINAGAHYDSNDYLYNNNWSSVGIRVSWNLLGLLKLPALEAAGENQAKVADLRRMALSMAVLTQVRVAAQRYYLAREQFSFAEESMQVDSRLRDFAKASASISADSRLEYIRADARWLLSQYQRYAAYSDAQAAWGRLYNSVGLDVMPDAIKSHDVATLANEIEKTMEGWERSTLLAAQSEVK